MLVALACNKDDDSASNCTKLQGKWEATSWKEDDEEFFGDTIFIISSVIEATEGAGRHVKNISLKEPSLETLFIELTGRKLD